MKVSTDTLRYLFAQAHLRIPIVQIRVISGNLRSGYNQKTASNVFYTACLTQLLLGIPPENLR